MLVTPPPCKLRHVLHVRRVVYRGESVSTYGATPPPSLAVVRPWCRLTSLWIRPFLPRALAACTTTTSPTRASPPWPPRWLTSPTSRAWSASLTPYPPWSHSHCRQGPAGTQRCSCAVQPVSEVTRGALRGTRTHPSLCDSPYVHCVPYRKGWL